MSDKRKIVVGVTVKANGNCCAKACKYLRQYGSNPWDGSCEAHGVVLNSIAPNEFWRCQECLGSEQAYLVLKFYADKHEAHRQKLLEEAWED